MQGQWPWSVERLRGQGLERFGGSEALGSGLSQHRSLLHPVPACDPHSRARGSRTRVAPQQRPGHPLHAALLLGDTMMAIGHRAHEARRAVLGVVALERRCLGRPAIQRALLRHAGPPARLWQQAPRRRLVPGLAQETGQGLPRLLRRTLERVPRAFALARRRVHAPAAPPQPRAAMPRRFPPGTGVHTPTRHGRVGARPPALLQEGCDMPGAQGRGDLPPHTQQPHLLRNVAPWKLLAIVVPPLWAP
jgi:hypothetical protein